MALSDKVLTIMLIFGMFSSLFVSASLTPLYRSLRYTKTGISKAMKKLIFSLIFVQAISIVTPFILVLAVTGLLTEAGANVATWVVTVATAISIIESIILGRWGFQTYKTLTTEYLLPPTPKV